MQKYYKTWVITILIIFILFSDVGSALNMIIKGETQGHFEMLESGVVARLLEEKWTRYIRVSKRTGKTNFATNKNSTLMKRYTFIPEIDQN